MIKRTQIFGWEHEPVDERPSEFMPSRFSESSKFSTLGAFDRTGRAMATPARKSPLMTPEARRSPPNESDKMLSRLVPRWLASLPPDTRPDYLCAHFPRIANRLALCWTDPSLALRLLDDLFRDKRGGRRGFPSKALDELTSLRRAALDGLSRKCP
jgi:hypothetical protein